MTNNIGKAISELIEIASIRGRISEKDFRKVCEHFFIKPRILETRFHRARGMHYRDVKVTRQKTINNLKAASEIARRRIKGQPGRYQHNYGKLSGEIAKNRYRSIVYVGSWPTVHGVDHEFIDVKTLETLIVDWWDLSNEFPEFYRRMLGQG